MSKKIGHAVLPDITRLLQAGIDPQTGLPLKFVAGDPSHLKMGIRRLLRVIDEQDAVNRFEWTNLPAYITSEELERMIYYKGQLAFFKLKDKKGKYRYYFMPYALDGTIDYYGRFNRIHPVPFTSGTDKGKEDENVKTQAAVLSLLKLNCIYTKEDYEELDDQLKNEDKFCVLIHDYTKQLSQNIEPRQILMEPLLDVMADTIPFLRTAMIAATGVRGMRVPDADSADEVDDANKNLYNDALIGNLFEPIEGAVEFQDLLEKGAQGKLQEFMESLQSLDNFRLSCYGLDNGGMFEKKSHMLEEEQEVNQSNVKLVLEDGLQIRKNFCEIVNSIFGLNISVEVRDVQTGLKLSNGKNSTITYSSDKGGNGNGTVDTDL